MRTPLMVIAIIACLIMSVVGGLIPIPQGWIFFVIALYLLATEFETGRRWVKTARRRWPSTHCRRDYSIHLEHGAASSRKYGRSWSGLERNADSPGCLRASFES